jgi:hypothetical protein
MSLLAFRAGHGPFFDPISVYSREKHNGSFAYGLEPVPK